jgi:hypothetical protein
LKVGSLAGQAALGRGVIELFAASSKSVAQRRKPSR